MSGKSKSGVAYSYPQLDVQQLPLSEHPSVPLVPSIVFPQGIHARARRYAIQTQDQPSCRSPTLSCPHSLK